MTYVGVMIEQNSTQKVPVYKIPVSISPQASQKEVYLNASFVSEEVWLHTINHYVRVRQNMVAQFIAT